MFWTSRGHGARASIDSTYWTFFSERRRSLTPKCPCFILVLQYLQMYVLYMYTKAMGLFVGLNFEVYPTSGFGVGLLTRLPREGPQKEQGAAIP